MCCMILTDYYCFIISVEKLPTNYTKNFATARAVTSASGKGAVVQHDGHLYELSCNVSSCSWSIMKQKVYPKVNNHVMMNLPPAYRCL